MWTRQQQMIWQIPNQCLIQIHRGVSGMIVWTRVWSPGPLLTCSVTTGKLHELSEPHFPPHQ